MEAALGFSSLINATLLGELMAFGLFFILFARWVWPPLAAKLDARQAALKQGLEASEAARKQWAAAEIWAQERADEAQREIAAQKTAAAHEMEAWAESQRIEVEQQRRRQMEASHSEIEELHQSMQATLQVEMADWVAEAVERFVQSRGWSLTPTGRPEILEGLTQLRHKAGGNPPPASA